MSLFDTLNKAGSIKSTPLESSPLFYEKDSIPTDIPIINIALSGKTDGGLSAGLTFLAGPSKHFKSLLGLIMVKAYMSKYEDAVCLFYDSEFGITPDYITTNGIDTGRVIHIPIENVEQLRSDFAQRLECIKRGDKVIVFIDSIGNLASKKETVDAINENSAADMTRAKTMKSLWRIVTPALTSKNIPCIAVNHTYQCGTEEMMALTPDGPKSLKDFAVGDTVLTSAGYEAVSFVTQHEDAYVTDIELEDGTTMSFTGGHRFMVNNEWVYVDDLKEGMELDLINSV